MKLKNVFVLAVIMGVLFACDNPQKKKEAQKTNEQTMKKTEQTTTTVTRFEELKGYFVNNDVVFDKDYKFVVVSNNEDFDKYFGIAKTMGNEISELNFEKFNVAGILSKPSNRANKIEVTTYTSKKGKTSVGFIDKVGDEQNFTSGALLLFKIPKSIISVDFVSGSATVNVEVE